MTLTVNATTSTMNATTVLVKKAKRTELAELAAHRSVCKCGMSAPTVSSTVTRTIYEAAMVYELVTRYNATYTPAPANFTKTAVVKSRTTVATDYFNITSTDIAV